MKGDDEDMKTKSDGNKGALKPVHLEAIERLVSGESVTGTAEAIGMSRQHLSGLINGNPYFMAALEQRQSEALKELRGNLREALFTALNTVTELLRNEETPQGVRLQTAASLVNRLSGFFLADVTPPRTALTIAGEMAGRADFEELTTDVPARDKLLKSAQMELDL